VAGQSFHGDEAQSHVLPGSEYQFGEASRPGMSEERETHQPVGRQHEDFYDEDDGDGTSQDEQNLADHGFNWEQSTNAENGPLVDKYVSHQHDPEGNHIATHTIHNADGRWHLESSPLGSADDPMASYTSHGFSADAVDKYRQNAAEALLHQRGYEPLRGRTGWARHWTKSDPGGYEHEIHFPEEGGFRGSTINHDVFPSAGTFASNGVKTHHSYDLADVVREQDRMSKGMHPGGTQDYRLTRDELLGHPSVAALGQPGYVSDNFYGDGKVGKAIWRMPHPEGNHLGVNAEATYDWDKGGYDFKYTHDGVPLAATHNYVPAGAPVHVPGRQSRPTLEGSS
jgi:hypothetical protein